MSSEVFQIVQKLNPRSLEIQLILQCAPLIAGLKTSNLLKVNSENEKDVFNLFHDSDISCYPMIRYNKKTIFFLYRKDMLSAHIAGRESRKLLRSMGYGNDDYMSLIVKVGSKYQTFASGESEFPHELGLLLGYPCEDVRGFMEDHGRHALVTGYWKVYDKPEEKIRIFESYEKAKELQVRLVSVGMTLPMIMKHFEKGFPHDPISE